jgi:hypothetical protein
MVTRSLTKDLLPKMLTVLSSSLPKSIPDHTPCEQVPSSFGLGLKNIQVG